MTRGPRSDTSRGHEPNGEPPVRRERPRRAGVTPVAGTLLALLAVAAAAPGSWLVLDRVRPAGWTGATPAPIVSPPNPAESGATGALVTQPPSLAPSAPASASSSTQYGTGQWTALKPLDKGLWGAGFATLPDGRILVVGGSKGPTSSDATADVKLLDPATGAWQPMTAMLQARAYPMVVALQDGSVLVVGGSRAGVPLDSVERYTPDSDTWVAVNRMHHPRTHGTATLLPNGKVLVTGGGTTSYPSFAATATAEVFDPATGNWTSVPDMSSPRVLQTASLLPNGTVLVAGGATTYRGPGTVRASAEVFDPASNSWHATGAMSVPRYTQSAVALPDGRILVAGGWSFTTDADPSLASVDIYDPATGKWSGTGPMTTGRAQFRMASLPDGRVLAVGGVAPDYSTLASCELFDPATGSWTATGSLPFAIMWPVLVGTDSGRIYIVGGAKDASVNVTSNIVAYYLAPPPK